MNWKLLLASYTIMLAAQQCNAQEKRPARSSDTIQAPLYKSNTKKNKHAARWIKDQINLYAKEVIETDGTIFRPLRITRLSKKNITGADEQYFPNGYDAGYAIKKNTYRIATKNLSAIEIYATDQKDTADMNAMVLTKSKKISIKTTWTRVADDSYNGKAGSKRKKYTTAKQSFIFFRLDTNQEYGFIEKFNQAAMNWIECLKTD